MKSFKRFLKKETDGPSPQLCDKLISILRVDSSPIIYFVEDFGKDVNDRRFSALIQKAEKLSIQFKKELQKLDAEAADRVELTADLKTAFQSRSVEDQYYPSGNDWKTLKPFETKCKKIKDDLIDLLTKLKKENKNA